MALCLETIQADAGRVATDGKHAGGLSQWLATMTARDETYRAGLHRWFSSRGAIFTALLKPEWEEWKRLNNWGTPQGEEEA